GDGIRNFHVTGVQTCALPISRWLGKPVQLVTFARQGVAWRYCTADRDITVGGHTYLSARGMTVSEIRDTAERAKNNVTITVPYRSAARRVGKHIRTTRE